MSDRRLRLLLSTMGAVATVAGTDGVVRGTDAVLAKAAVSADIDSEFRFFAAWYATAGLALLRAGRSDEARATAVQLSCVGLLLGAVGRVLSMKRLGRPSPLYRALLAIEIGLPVVLAVWHERTQAPAAADRAEGPSRL